MTGVEREKMDIGVIQQRLTCLDDKAALDSDSARQTGFPAEACPARCQQTCISVSAQLFMADGHPGHAGCPLV